MLKHKFATRKTKDLSMVECLLCADPCKDARAGNFCADFKPTRSPEARLMLKETLGEEMLYKVLIKKGKDPMGLKTKDAWVEQIISEINAGDLEAIGKYRDASYCIPTYPMLAINQLIGDNRYLGNWIRTEQKNPQYEGVDPIALKGELVVRFMEELTQGLHRGDQPAPAPAPVVEELPFEPDAPKEEPKPAPKKRRSRKKATPAPAPVEGFNFELAFKDTQAAIAEIDTGLKEALPKLRVKQHELQADITCINKKLDMFKEAFAQFEQELVMSGTINAAPFSEATFGWDNLDKDG